MSREWMAIYSAMATKPRYRRLTPIGRGVLLQVFLLAGFQSPEATWDDREELREALTLEGFPAASLDELVGLGWLVEDDGALVIRDWDKHQRAGPCLHPPSEGGSGMTRHHPEPSVLDRLQVGGLKPELVEAFRRLHNWAELERQLRGDRHQRRTPFRCEPCLPERSR